MNQRIDVLNEKTSAFNGLLTNKQKELIYFRSVENFLFYINQLSASEKGIVVQQLEGYFALLEDEGFEFHFSQKKEILKSIIEPIAYYYIKEFHFKFYMGLKYSLFIGINIDIFLLLIGVLKKVSYVPIATSIFIIYWLYVELFFAKKRKVY